MNDQVQSFTLTCGIHGITVDHVKIEFMIQNEFGLADQDIVDTPDTCAAVD